MEAALMAHLGDVSRQALPVIERSSSAVPAAPWPNVGTAMLNIPPKQGGGGGGGESDNFYGAA